MASQEELIQCAKDCAQGQPWKDQCILGQASPQDKCYKLMPHRKWPIEIKKVWRQNKKEEQRAIEWFHEADRRAGIRPWTKKEAKYWNTTKFPNDTCNEKCGIYGPVCPKDKCYFNFAPNALPEPLKQAFQDCDAFQSKRYEEATEEMEKEMRMNPKRRYRTINPIFTICWCLRRIAVQPLYFKDRFLYRLRK